MVEMFSHRYKEAGCISVNSPVPWNAIKHHCLNATKLSWGRGGVLFLTTMLSLVLTLHDQSLHFTSTSCQVFSPRYGHMYCVE